MNEKETREVLKRLEHEYAGAGTELDYSTPYELLVSTILAAQCTDRRVNIITDELFKQYNTPGAMITLTQPELEGYIKSCGLYSAKAKNILAMSRKLVDEYGGIVPDTIEELTKLPGVGRKTADVVASIAFGVPAIPVDTHVFRVSNRIGLAHAKDVLKTELQLMEAIPRKNWSAAHHWILYHGRRVCHARKPECRRCFLADVCEYNKINAEMLTPSPAEN